MVFTLRVTAKLLSDFNIHKFGWLQGSQHNRHSTSARPFTDITVQQIPKSTADLSFSVFFFIIRRKRIYNIMHFTKSAKVDKTTNHYSYSQNKRDFKPTMENQSPVKLRSKILLTLH